MLAFVVAVVVALFGGALALAYVALLSRRSKAAAGSLSLIECAGSVVEPLCPEGAVLVGGELWRARSRTGEMVPRGSSNVRVVGARGHLLEVVARG